jgi:hypothetical protein
MAQERYTNISTKKKQNQNVEGKHMKVIINIRCA